MKIARVDGSYVVRIPDDVVAALGLKEGDDVDLTVRSRDGVDDPNQRREALLSALGSLKGRLPAGYRFDREEANAR